MVSEKTIGKYTILEVLGKGATSTVYKCLDPFTKNIYALKMLDKDNDSKAFMHEAGLVGKLNHPSIAKICDAFEHEDCNCIVIEYVDGTTLEQFVHNKEKFLPTEEIVQIIFKCCLALDYAAKNNIIHRDVKPANIMYTKNKDIKITDFGASYITGTTSTQVLGVGSPAYMSPEQIQEESLDLRADIYSLGVVMYCMLTGMLPYDAENLPALIHKKITENPVPITKRRQDLDEELVRIIHKTLNREKNERYGDWADFAMDLAFWSKLRESKSNKTQTAQKTHTQVQDSERYNLIKSLDFFKKFNEAELLETIKICEWAKFEPNKTLIKEGEIGQSFFIIAEGQADVIKNDVTVATIGLGDCFGEISHLVPLKPRRTATVISKTDITLIKINGQRVHAAKPDIRLRFSESFIDILVQRLDKANMEIIRLKTKK